MTDSGDYDIHDALGELVAAITRQGTIPTYLIVSWQILRASGWDKVAIRDDRGNLHILGMQVVVVQYPVLTLTNELPDDNILSQLDKFEPVEHEGKIMLRCTS